MIIWRPSSLSELTPKISNTGLTHLGSKASIYVYTDNFETQSHHETKILILDVYFLYFGINT